MGNGVHFNFSISSIPSMILTRRNFLSLTASAAVLPAVDRNGILFERHHRIPRPVLAGLVRLDKNENPQGPFASARKAIEAAMVDAGRYPGSAEAVLRDAIARMHGVKPEQVVMGCGSGEILKLCTERFTSGTRGVVGGQPTFESPAAYATQMKRPAIGVPLTKTLHLDLDRMATAAKGHGLVFLCNPNNPTSTVHNAASVRGFIARVRRESPQTMILVDEAYHEYVDDPAYATMIPETKDPNVIVSRTFSKVFGMAGIRCGYAICAAETAEKLEPWRVDSGVSQLAAAAALASLDDKAAIRAEQTRNREVRAIATKWFIDRGFTPAKSDANFLFVDIKRDVKPVIAACFEKGIAVGRPFPPLETHLRLTMGLQPEMEKALEVLKTVLT
jgi:histidinol-phosphate aminotransferase